MSNKPATHTPGPWHIEREVDQSGDLRTWIIAPDGTDIETFAFSKEHAEAEPEQYALAQANVKLRSAAPELLEALRLMYAAAPISEEGAMVDAIKAARAAIQKATA